jgi:hypothetical protein
VKLARQVSQFAALAAMLAVLTALSGCGGSSVTTDSSELDGSWTLESLGGVSDLTPADPAVTSTLVLEDGQVSGNGAVNVEAVEVHDLVPGGDEVAHELRLRVGAGVDLGEARSWELEPKTRSTRVPVHFTCPVLRSRPSKTCLGARTAAFHSVPMSSRLTKKSLVSVRAVGEHAVLGRRCWR